MDSYRSCPSNYNWNILLKHESEVVFDLPSIYL